MGVRQIGNLANPQLEIGDFLPDFRLDDQRRKQIALLSYARGRPVVLLVCRAKQSPEAARVLCDFNEAERLLGPRAHVMAISGADLEENVRVADELGLRFPLLADPEQSIADALGLAHDRELDHAVTCVTTDANRRVLRVDAGLTEPGSAAEIARFLDSQPCASAKEIGSVAPVLILPGVFDQSFCRHLIDLYETGNQPTGIYLDDNRPAGGIIAPATKVRRDHIVRDPEINNRIGRLVGKRIVPEIAKAFSYRVSYAKGFKIGCYDASDQGFFQPHRDNIEPTGGRRFAMSLNLNTGEYEGGHLRFPEYGPDLYRPAAGSAIVFSCALVHEATPVTAGRRFVLLSFLFGDDGE